MSKPSLRDRFFAWFWRGKEKSIGEAVYERYASYASTWSLMRDFMEKAYIAGYRAGKRAKDE
jgi:hypothetical protein